MAGGSPAARDGMAAHRSRLERETASQAGCRSCCAGTLVFSVLESAVRGRWRYFIDQRGSYGASIAICGWIPIGALPDPRRDERDMDGSLHRLSLDPPRIRDWTTVDCREAARRRRELRQQLASTNFLCIRWGARVGSARIKDLGAVSFAYAAASSWPGKCLECASNQRNDLILTRSAACRLASSCPG